MGKFVLFWRIIPKCQCYIETVKLTKTEVQYGLTLCPYHGYVAVEKMIRHSYRKSEAEK
ncbi:MAG: hypothetical protein QXK47_02455 [Candidatus Bathyarchaeia archaeon]